MRWTHLLAALVAYSLLQWFSFKIWTLYYQENLPLRIKTQFYSVLEDDNTVLIYNRIPKTGSTSFMHLPYQLCDQNGFHVLLLNISHPHAMTFSDRVYFAKNLTHWKMPAIYHGHFAYFDVHNMGIHTGQTKVIYINIVRQPLDR